MPFMHPDDGDGRPAVGEYYIHRPTGGLVEIMAIEPNGDCLVLDVRAPLDDPWQHISASQIFSSFWQRVAPLPQAA